MHFLREKPFVFPILVLSLLLGLSEVGRGEDSQGDLIVKEIAFAFNEEGGEKVSISCSRSCIPELFALEGESPRVVMDLRNVSLLQTRARRLRTEGTFVKGIRTYLDRDTKILRIVLDMEPAKKVLVYPVQDPSDVYVLKVEEISPSVQRQEGSANGSPPGENRITIVDSRQKRTGDQRIAAAAPPAPQETGSAAESQTLPSAVRGRGQLNAGDFNAAVDTFTGILAAHPQDSLSYRLRGNAYDNLGDRQKALADWVQAARLGDGLLQSYLDFLQVQWRDKAAP